MEGKEVIGDVLVTQKLGTFEGWERVVIFGDDALGRLVGVDRTTIFAWREKGLITGKPFAPRSDGTAAYFIYDWEKVKVEIKNNIRSKKVQKKLAEMK